MTKDERLAAALRGLIAHVEDHGVASTKPGGKGAIRYEGAPYSRVTEAREALAKYEADKARPRHTCGATQHMRADGTPGTRVDYYATFEIAERVAQRCKALKTANLRPFRMIEE